MAYENITYEYILQRMIDRVSGKYPMLDVREGSIVFNALASAAVEIAIMYWEMDNAINESWIGTATREYKLEACKQMGMDITQFEASAGVHEAEFGEQVPIGSRWNCDLYNYQVTEFIEMNEQFYKYKVICETVGSSPNNVVGTLTPITDVSENPIHAYLNKCLIEGENETSDRDIVIAYYDYINSTITDGNVAQYKKWCNEYVGENGSRGIGNCKIFPLWNGDNTVKVSILSASNKVASDELVAEFQEYLDPGTTGMGNGVAPIGAFVTVSTATEKKINISADISMKSGYSDTSVIDTALTNYFSQIAYDKSIVAYMNIGAVILGTEGVESVNGLTLNGGTADISLATEEIPVLGTTDWT